MTTLSWETGYADLEQALPAFVTDPQTVSVLLADSWNHDVESMDDDEPVTATIKSKGLAVLKPTKGTLVSLAKAVAISKDMLVNTPPSLVQPVFNYWLSTAEDSHGPSFTVNNKGVATALVSPASVLPLTTTQVANEIKSVVQKNDPWHEPCFSTDFDLRHTRTSFAVLFSAAPGKSDPKDWVPGVHVVMSPSGNTPPIISGYAERASDGLGVILEGLDAKYSVRRHGKTLDAVLEWIQEAIGVIVVDVQNTLDEFLNLQTVDIEDDLEAVFSDLLKSVSLPISLQSMALESLEEFLSSSDEVSAYDLAVIVAELQNTPDETPERVDRVKRAAGLVPSVIGSRCSTCHSLLAHAH